MLISCYATVSSTASSFDLQSEWKGLLANRKSLFESSESASIEVLRPKHLNSPMIGADASYQEVLVHVNNS